MSIPKYLQLIVIGVFSLPGITAKAQVVNIGAGLKLVAEGPVSLVIEGAGMKNEGEFMPGNSTVYFDGAGFPAIAGTQPCLFYNLNFRGSGVKTNNGNAAVIATLGVQGTTTLDADGPSGNSPFTILSSDTSTGNVDKIVNGNITGNVIVERYINTGTGAGQHPKSWQLLATPTYGQTIYQSWQEAGATPPGYGTILTGTGTGFDISSPQPSIKYYNATNNEWTPVTNTSISLQQPLGYMLFVRGDRTVSTVNAPPNPTRMRSKGTLFTPLNPPPSIAVPANKFQSFGNPYASRVDFREIYLASTGINELYYAWDPRLNGNFNLGGYQTLSAVAGYVPTAGNVTANYPAGIPAPYIESGQAVFVRGNGSGGNLNFNENVKAPGNRLVTRETSNSQRFPAGRQFLCVTLFTGSGQIADGTIAAFEQGLGNEINHLDAPKPTNSGENLGFLREGQIWSVEARDDITVNDTLFLFLQQLKPQPYQLRFAPVAVSSPLAAFLFDRHLHSYTPISLTDSSFIDIVIGSDSAASDPGRFIIVFRTLQPVPVFFVNIAAWRQDDLSILVHWLVSNELEIREYVIERSTDAVNFSIAGREVPLMNNGADAAYEFIDLQPFSGTSFYRIRALSQDGSIQYSNVVKVNGVNSQPAISVLPNPVSGNKLTIHFHQLPEGMYPVSILNNLGQVVYTQKLYLGQANQHVTLQPSHLLLPGSYQLRVHTGKSYLSKAFVVVQ